MNANVKQEIVKLVVSVSVGSVINDALKSIQPAAQGPIGKACSLVGGLILSSMVTDQANTWVVSQIAQFKTK